MFAASKALFICSRKPSLIFGIRATAAGLTQKRTIKNTPYSPISSMVADVSGRFSTTSLSANTCKITSRAFSISSSKAIRMRISKRIKFFEVKLVTTEEATFELGIITVILSRVKTWVVRKAITTTRPSLSLILTQSPT